MASRSHMALLRGAPFLRLVVPLAIGIALGEYAGGFSSLSALALPACFGWLVYYTIRYRWTESYPLRYRHGLISFLVFLTLGGGLVESARWQWRNAARLVSHASAPYLLVRVDAEPSVRARAVRLDVTLLAACDSTTTAAAHGRAVLFVERDGNAEAQVYGNLLMIRNQLALPSGPKNPGEFDYPNYLRRKGISHQAYLRADQWTQVGYAPASPQFARLMKLRASMLERLANNGISGEEYAVLSALILGKTDDISDALMSAYAASGTVHVLAVSGMHVALLFFMISWLLKPLKKLRRGEKYAALGAMVLIWTYATLTGYSPSVLRAAVMFTAMLTGGLLDRNANIFNTIALSAFGLLVVDPYLLFDAGFQLSYLAVAGIVVYQQKIYSALYLPARWLDQAWKLVSVSVAAQLLTFPLGFFYFQQFPVYFILSNLVVVPLSTLILYGCVALYALDGFWAAGQYLAAVLRIATGVMNRFAAWVESLPGSVFSGISPGVFDTLLLFVFTGFFTSWLLWRRRHHLAPALCSLCLLLGAGLWRMAESGERHDVCVHALQEGVGITCRGADTSYFIYHGTDPVRASARLGRYWASFGHPVIALPHSAAIADSAGGIYLRDGLLTAGRFHLLLADSTLDLAATAGFPADAVVVLSAHSIPPEDRSLPLCLVPRSLPGWYKRQWSGRQSPDRYFLLEQGAMVGGAEGLQPFTPPD